MVFDLVRKETLLHDTSSYKYKWQKYLIRAIKGIFIGLFIALECFIFLALNEKIDEYSSYGIFDFLILFLFIMFIVSIVNSLFVLRKLLFDKKDSSILLPLPISSGEIIFSKLFYLFFEQVLLNLCISTPLLISFGATHTLVPYFYVFSLVYPLMMSLITISISLTLVVPFEYLYNFLKKYDIAQFVLASIVVILLCFAYKYVLDLFLTALNDSSFGGVFSSDFVNGLHNISIFLVPISNILDVIVNGGNALSAVSIYLGMLVIFFIIGINLSSYFYNKMNKLDYYKTSSSSKKQKEIKVLSVSKALIKKEFIMLFKDNSYIFSYTGLLIMMPFLSFVVINSLNSIIYDNLRIYAVYFPELINGLNLALILLFIAVINANASLSVSREEKAIQIVKYLPIDPFKQMAIKLIAPISLSSASLLISEIVLVSTSTINWYICLVSLVLGLALIVFTNVFGILVDMHDKNSNIKYKLSYLTSLISIVYPLFILALHFLLSFVSCPVALIYILEILITGGLLAPLFIKINTRIRRLFNLMEVN